MDHHDKVVTTSDYRFVEKDESETSYVQLMGDTPWKGTVFQFGNLRIIEPELDSIEEATLSFSYRIIDTPLSEDAINKDTTFKNHIGAVLEHILADAFETGEYKLGSDDSNNDSEEPTT